MRDDAVKSAFLGRGDVPRRVKPVPIGDGLSCQGWRMLRLVRVTRRRYRRAQPWKGRAPQGTDEEERAKIYGWSCDDGDRLAPQITDA